MWFWPPIMNGQIHPFSVRDTTIYVVFQNCSESSNYKKFTKFEIQTLKLGAVRVRGGSRIFSREGGGFSKNFPTFWRLFFLGRPNWFFKLSQSTVLPLFLLNFLCRRRIFEKTVKKAVFEHFEKCWQKNRVFFGARSPSKLIYVGALRKILGSVGQKWISEKVSKGGSFGSAESRIPEGGSVRPPPPLPKSALGQSTVKGCESGVQLWLLKSFWFSRWRFLWFSQFFSENLKTLYFKNSKDLKIPTL